MTVLGVCSLHCVEIDVTDCFVIPKVIGINQAKIAQIRDALVTVQNGITDGTGSLHKPLFEAYADKVSRIFSHA